MTDTSKSESVCVYDFFGRAGPYYPVTMFADWCDGVVYFGGIWCHIPDWKVETPPSAAEVEEYVRQHDPRDDEEIYKWHRDRRNNESISDNG